MAPAQVLTGHVMMDHCNLKHSLDEPDSSPPEGNNLCIATTSARTQHSINNIPKDIAKDELPQQEIPPEAAYRMIQDDLAWDIHPAQNLGTFVTTTMDSNAQALITSTLPKNYINHESYPGPSTLQTRCIAMLAHLFHAPVSNFIGTSTVGSSEAILLAALALKKRWIARQKALDRDCSKPNLVLSSAAQVCWKKAARYFDIELRLVDCTPERRVIDPHHAIKLVDRDTIGICAILGTTYTGEYEDVAAINDLLGQRGMDVPIHVDAASGGFVAPFLDPGLRWDFRLDKVISINVSGHKYGLVYAGIGWVIWRGEEFLPDDLIFTHTYLGTSQSSITLTFSRSASPIIAQYYQLLRLGRSGYRRIMLQLSSTAQYLATNLEQLGFVILSCRREGHGLPLVAFCIDVAKGWGFDEFGFADELRRVGWVVPAYRMGTGEGEGEGVKMLRVVVREEFGGERCEAFLEDVRGVLRGLRREGAGWGGNGVTNDRNVFGAVESMIDED